MDSPDEEFTENRRMANGAPRGPRSTPWQEQPWEHVAPRVRSRIRTRKVQLAVSELGGLPGVAAYHSSVLIDGRELFFGYTNGIQASRGLASHAKLGRKPTILDMGITLCSGAELAFTLAPYFEKGSYDLLRKNCNSFSDCALFILLGKRLDAKYCALERMASNMPSLVRLGSGGHYVPNPKAADFDVNVLIEKTLVDCIEFPPAPLERAMSDMSSLRVSSRPPDARFAFAGEVGPRKSPALADGAGTGEEGPASEALHKAVDALRIFANAFLAPCRSPLNAEEGDCIYTDEDLAQRLRPYQEEDAWADEAALRSRPIPGRSISVGGG